jgi:methionyl-tRNA synthetase
VSSDQLRFYLALTNPEIEQTDFVLEDFREATDRRLTGPWNELHGRLAAALAERSAGSGAGPAPLPAELTERLGCFARHLEEAYGLERFSLRRAAELLAEALAAISENATASLARPGERGGGLSAALTGARAFAFFAGPLMPRFATRLREALGPEGGWDSYRSPVDPRAVRWTADLALLPLAGADLRF